MAFKVYIRVVSIDVIAGGSANLEGAVTFYHNLKQIDLREMGPIVGQADEVSFEFVDPDVVVVAGDPMPSQRIDLLLHGLKGLDDLLRRPVYEHGLSNFHSWASSCSKFAVYAISGMEFLKFLRGVQLRDSGSTAMAILAVSLQSLRLISLCEEKLGVH